MRLPRNGIHGKLPRELGSLSKLEVLRLENNQLKGPIPSPLLYMCVSGQIKDYAFFNNSGLTLPGDIGKLTVLTKLEITNQNLVGPLPKTLHMLAHLKVQQYKN